MRGVRRPPRSLGLPFTIPGRAQTISGSPDLVVSRVYTRGGEPGAAFQNDFVELFNRGNRPVDINDWALHLALDTSPYPTTSYIEFQRTGFLVHRLYRASLPERGYRPRSLPRYLEFVRDTQEVGRGVVVGEPGWEWRLEQNIGLFLQDFMSRPEFALAYPPQMDALPVRR